jgi:membrane protease YdiL (CAAX protease family)
MENANYPKIKNAIFLCLLLLVIQLGLGVVTGFIIGILEYGTESFAFGVGTILAQVLSFGTVILIGYKKTGRKFNEVFLFKKVPLYFWPAVIVFMFGFIILSSELDNLLTFICPMPDFLRNTFEIVMARQAFIVSIILVGIIPAITEEMLFRGILISGFKENYTEKKTIIMTALFFGIVHLNPWQFVSAFIIGLFSAWICLKTRSILLSVYIHLFNNVLGVVVLKFRDIIPVKGFNTAYTGEMSFQPLWFDMAGIIITALGVLLIIRSIKKAKSGA